MKRNSYKPSMIALSMICILLLTGCAGSSVPKVVKVNPDIPKLPKEYGKASADHLDRTVESMKKL